MGSPAIQQRIRIERRLQPGRAQAGGTVLFRLVYYAVMFLVCGVLVGVLYLGSLLD